MTLIKPALSAHPIAAPFAFRRSDTAVPQDALTASAQSPDAATERKPDRMSELETLQGIVRDLTRQLEITKSEGTAAQEAARAEGYEQGLRDAASREEERSALFAQALEDSLRAVGSKLDRERDIAIELTLATLTSILGDPRRQAALVAETAGRWAETLKSSKILRVRISADDFATPAAAAVLGEQLGGLSVDIDHSLPPGSCLFHLELGHVDASLHVQAAAATAYLAEHGTTADRAA